MSVTFSVVFETKVPRHGTLGGDNPALEKAQKQLDRVARAAGLRALSDFESYDPADVAADFDMDVDEAALPPVEWFAAADGLAAVRALAAHLRANPTAVRGSAKVLEDLASVEAELAAADRAGVRFRFAVVP